jgi:NAD(P)-dependent dehydrogenase (short-subunit alcohol dehydrogenase family)
MSADGLDARVWFITGASSGFGRSIAEEALARGEKVVATARRPETIGDLAGTTDERVLAVKLDVTNAAQRQSAIDAAIERFGRIDVLVNNAGRTQVGAVEETTEEELRGLFELHFFAPVALTAAVLPIMRAQGGGVIVQMSSVGGQVTAPGFGVYCATKFALEGLTETLAEEVVPFGIRCLIVEPGAFRTELFSSGGPVLSRPMTEYAGTVGATRDYVNSNDGKQPGDPRKAAAAIAAAIDAEETPLRLVLGADAIGNIRSRLERVADELSLWEEVGRNTNIEA